LNAALYFRADTINPGVETVLEYLILKFPRIKPAIWQQRVAQGKVHWHDGRLITAISPFKAQQRVYYYREVENEAKIPFEEKILFQDEHILVAFKPHFLALTPGGIYVNECLQQRLRIKTGNQQLQTLHRLDRVTAGLVLFSLNKKTRHHYHELFKNKQINKTYQAIASTSSNTKLIGQQWLVENRIEKSQQGFRMQVSNGEPNSHSQIRCLAQSNDKALFELSPITGKTHQLRLHMASLGMPILFDKYYPELEEESADDYAKPLQLLAKKLKFIDPITGQKREFSTDEKLSMDNTNPTK